MSQIKRIVSLILSAVLVISSLAGDGLSASKVPALDVVKDIIENEIKEENNENNTQKQDPIASKVDAEDQKEVNFETNFVSGTTNASDEENNEEIDDAKENVTENVTEDLIASLIDKELSNDKTPENIVDENGDLNVPFDIAYPDIFNSDEVEYADNALLIKVKNTYSDKTVGGLKEAGIGKMETMFEVDNATWYTAYLLKGVNVNEAMEQVRQVSGILTAEYNFKYETALAEGESAAKAEVSKNPNNKDQWANEKFGILKGWAKHREKTEKENGNATGGGSSSVIVAVIDTGVDYTHEDLKNSMWKNINEIPNNGIDDDANGYVDDYYGVDITNPSADTANISGMDDNGHGTHVAGIIGAENNNKGMVGYAYNAKIMNVKAGDASGYFMQNNVANAIIYAYNHGADVINMSFGGSASSIAVQDALAVAYSRCVLVASAGNDGLPNEFYSNSLPNYPAAFSYVLGVMSVGETNKESSFTNWDVYSFNSIEYEVYAPGEQIISTLPGDRYGKLSGTSMAAPVVSAQAALLRSYYDDRETYTTKFIYGQIVGTAEQTVECLDLGLHGIHSIPGVINFYESMTQLPVPDVNVSDYTIFDTENLIEDATSNNGDGVVDAGEIIALGFTLRNHWGMSEDTIVHIDTSRESGVENPYVTFLNNDINYESIGTYSESDCGKLYSEDGEVWNGWENPFFIQVAPNCPNDYSINLYVTITYKNGLDKNDKETYTTEIKEPIRLTVRRGEILPNKVTEDMTLTKDNYYIIPNSMIIMEGATVTVEAGTQIQFWCSDPADAYADTAIAYLNVAGKFICEGTEEEPVELFPSGWMDQYRVQIQPYNDGYISLTHTNVTNPYIRVDEAINCTFTQNYKGRILYRFLSSGVVDWAAGDAEINVDYAKDSAFYKLGGNYLYDRALLAGNYDGCIFVDSGIKFNSVKAVENCVFYGNNNYLGSENEGATSSWEIGTYDISCFTPEAVVRNEETGKTYLIAEGGRNYAVKERIAEMFGGSIVSFDNQEEMLNVFKMITDYCNEQYDYHYTVDIETGGCKIDNVIYNYDGSSFILDSEEISDFVSNDTKRLEYHAYYGDNRYYYVYYHYLDEPIKHKYDSITYEYDYGNQGIIRYATIYEIPGEIYISNIALDEYLVNIDMEETYQINATVTPSTADKTTLIYESQDESIVRVDKNGHVTPVGAGTTTVRVYAPDYAIYNYVTVNVMDVVELESLDIANGDEITVNVNEPLKLKVVYGPSYATKRAVSYTSTDSSVVSVDERGYITGLKEGQATITVTGYNNISAKIVINVIVPTEKMEFADNMYVTSLDEEDGTKFYPVFTPVNATNQELIWESSNPEVCYVDDAGKLIKLKEGTADLKATLKGTNLSDVITVAVTEKKIVTDIVKMEYRDGYVFALLSDGTLWVWGTDLYTPKQVKVGKICDFALYHTIDLYTLDEYGNVNKFTMMNSMTNVTPVDDFEGLSNISSISNSENGLLFAIANDGSAWAWGTDYNNMSGTGSNSLWSSNTPVQVQIEESVVKIVSLTDFTAFLTENGNVYVSGGDYINSGYNITIPKLMYNHALDIYKLDCQSNSTYDIGIKSKTGFVRIDRSLALTEIDIHQTDEYVYLQSGYEIIDGKVYLCNGIYKGGEMHTHTLLDGIDNISKVFYIYGCYFFITGDAKVYAIGKGSNYILGTGNEDDVLYPTQINIGLKENEGGIILQNWSAIENQIATNKDIVLDFSQTLEVSSSYAYITLKNSNNNAISITKTLDLDKLIINPRANLTVGEEYTLTIPAGALTDRAGNLNEEIILTFIAVEGEDEENDNITGSGTPSQEPSLDDEIEEEVVNDIVVDEELLAKRDGWTVDEVMELWNQFAADGLDTKFYSNVILNRLNDDDVTTWLRIEGGQDYNQSFGSISFGGNYWGTTNMDLINKQILDFDDYQTLLDINPGAILTEAPENTFPYVVNAYLEVDGELVEIVGNDLVTFTVEFNRDMDTSIPLDVKFGSSYPYAEHVVEGAYVDEDGDGASRIWKGTMKLTTIIENGYQYWSVGNGKAAGTALKLYTDWGRFPFKIDTTAAQALTMQAEVTDTGIKLTWEQDDFETLAGYNVYRATEEDGLYTRLNKTVIPADTKEWFDDEVMPGQRYYYNFTVVESDMAESEPSGKVQVTAMDTMAPNIYHTPVYHAFTGSNLVITAEVTDNVAISSATLYYRTTGTDTWKSITMTNFNDKYSAIIPSSEITVDGLEYYIEATDGNSYTYKGSAENPYSITVQLAVSDSEKGDVDGNGTIELRDALMVLMAINDRLNLTEEQFVRANLNNDQELSADEALRILQYANGMISSVLP